MVRGRDETARVSVRAARVEVLIDEVVVAALHADDPEIEEGAGGVVLKLALQGHVEGPYEALPPAVGTGEQLRGTHVGESVDDGGRVVERLGQPDARSPRWDVDAPGAYELCVRAHDAAGSVQPTRPAWNRQGMANNAVQRISVIARSPSVSV